MNLERQKRLVEKLLERTRAGSLSWEDAADDRAFQVSFSSNTVRISFRGSHRAAEYQIEIIDGYGQTTEIFNDLQLETDGAGKTMSWNSMMQEIYASARRKALKADEVIDSILSEIG